MPNPETGEPRPPHAPRLTARDRPTPTDRAPLKQPPLPDGAGPILEWSQYRRRDGWYATAGTWFLGAALLTANYKNFDWITDWIYWPIFASALWFYPRVVRKSWLAAGATWVQNDRAWVNTYELVKIELVINGIQRVIRLTDSSGRQAPAIDIKDIQPNIALWDLVYNGMLHSIANGNCEVTPRAQRVLKLPAGQATARRRSS
ncbi:hypothetical protein FK531_20360 [Rhodococcus spelaei]|uniref:Uncharacterized protein n=1 Tax=Rhodococcus spelaei TaxID=2546320 RepID=A0A541B0E3_9NOCA|nr:hypothetical protein [Rhodococcus spelaei]TQF65785.1 hypothetical protein FK531_20360 [Rhodococcus spelaei]